MIVNKIADAIVFRTLKKIKHGFLEITNFDGDVLKFGDINDKLKSKVIIKHPSLNYNLINNGSIGWPKVICKVILKLIIFQI